MPPEDSTHYGVYTARVRDVNDPDSLGRVKIILPWTLDTSSPQEVWARVATLMAGRRSGTWFIPDVDAEVLVAFEEGDARRPYVVGVLWNDDRKPPESMDGRGKNYKKIIKSRNGVTITLDDQDGQEQLVLETPGGQKLILKDGPGSVEIVDSNGNSAKFESSGVTITASAVVTVNAGTIRISAGMVTVDASMTKFSGVVQADTVIANSIVGSSYTPGAGNIW